MKRAVITGLGIVSSIGNTNPAGALDSLKNSRSDNLSQEFKEMGLRSHIWVMLSLILKVLLTVKSAVL